MALKYKYYTGLIECQFELVDSKPLGNSGNKQNKFNLHPNFRFFNFKEIDKDQYESNTKIKNAPFVHHKKEESIHFIEEKHEDQFKFISDELFLILGNNEEELTSKQKEAGQEVHIPKTHSKERILVSQNEILNYPSSLSLNSFLVNNDKHKFGRFHGFAFVRIFEHVPDIIENTISSDYHKCKFKDNIGLQCDNNIPLSEELCILHKPKLITGNEFIDPVPKSGGCFDNSTLLSDKYLSPIGLNAQGVKGCFNGSNNNPSGCFKPQISNSRRWGCGLFSLIPLLILLWFLWCLLFGKCGECNKQNTSNSNLKAPDTVYVEVFRELKDTLKIIQMDTVNFVDSTVNNRFDMVSLPNVQFFTDSDVLLPSSAKELQQLAEYLNNNDSLTAVVVGHTDNTGDPKQNLELSQKRAESVQKFLESLGVKKGRIQAKGLGDKLPKASNNTNEGRLMNRRVEVQLLKNEFVVTKRSEVPKEKGNK